MPRANHSRDNAGEAFCGDSTIDGVWRWRFSIRQSGGGEVVAHGLNDGGDGGGQHASKPGDRHSGRAELDCKIPKH